MSTPLLLHAARPPHAVSCLPTSCVLKRRMKRIARALEHLGSWMCIGARLLKHLSPARIQASFAGVAVLRQRAEVSTPLLLHAARPPHAVTCLATCCALKHLCREHRALKHLGSARILFLRAAWPPHAVSCLPTCCLLKRRTKRIARALKHLGTWMCKIGHCAQPSSGPAELGDVNAKP